MTTKIEVKKNVDIKPKIASLKCSWIRRFSNESHHDWKIIPLRI